MAQKMDPVKRRQIEPLSPLFFQECKNLLFWHLWVDGRESDIYSNHH